MSSPVQSPRSTALNRSASSDSFSGESSRDIANFQQVIKSFGIDIEDLNNSSDPIAIKDITINNNPDGTIKDQAIEEGFAEVPKDDLLAEQFVTSHDLESQQSQGMIAKLKNTFWKALGY